MKSFELYRHKWEKEVQQKYALDIYKRVWPGCDVTEIDLETDTSVSLKKLDFSGLDKLVIWRGVSYHIAQRFRGPREDGDVVDFSFRYKTPDNKGGIRKAEFFNLKNAYNNNGWMPNFYVFGITVNGPSELNQRDSGGFLVLYIYELKRMIKAIVDGRLKEIGVYRNSKGGVWDGSSGIYYALDDLTEFEFYRCFWGDWPDNFYVTRIGVCSNCSKKKMVSTYKNDLWCDECMTKATSTVSEWIIENGHVRKVIGKSDWLHNIEHGIPSCGITIPQTRVST